MVLKEDLVWFKNLQPRKRIDYMCGLLDMCLPLELRFIGTVLEDIAKKDFNCLRDAEIKANIVSNLEMMNEVDSERSRGRTFGMTSEVFRARLHVYLALLHSNNTSCANVIFNILEKQFDYMLNFLHNKQITEDICTILTLACHHPAFQFYQRCRLSDALKKAESRAQQIGDENEAHLPPPGVAYRPMTFCKTRPPDVHLHSDKVRVRSIQVKGLQPKEDQQNKKGPSVYDVHTTWSNGEITQAFMKYRDFEEIHHKLLDKFPEWKNTGVSIPAQRKHKDEQRDGVSNLNAYLSELMKAPIYVQDCDILTHPLHNGKLVQPSMAVGNPGAFPGAFVYQGGNQVYEYKYPDHFRMPFPTYQYPNPTLTAMSPGTPSPANSRPSSPISNKTKAAAGSMKSNNGRIGSQQNLVDEDIMPAVEPVPVLQLLRLCDLDKYSDNLSCYSVEQLLNLSKEELEQTGIPVDAQDKLRSKLDQYKQNPQDVSGLMKISSYNPLSDQQALPPVRHPEWHVYSSQEVMLNSGQLSSHSHGPHQPYHPVSSSLASPQSHNTTGDCSPANSEVCSPSPSPALHLSDSPQNSPVSNIIHGSSITLPSSSEKSVRNLQVDSSGSEDDRIPGIEGAEVIMGNQVYGRLPFSNSVPLISQALGPPGFVEKKVNAMPPIHMSALDPAMESNAQPAVIPQTCVAATLVNGYISDTSFMAHNAPSVIHPHLLNNRAYKQAQPTHTTPGRHQNVVNMPGPDQASQSMHNMNKNGNGLNPVMPSVATALNHQYMMPPPPVAAVCSQGGNSTMSSLHALQSNNGAPQSHSVGGQSSMLPSGIGANETAPLAMYPHYVYLAQRPNVPPQHRGILNTMANSTVVMTTTQSHPTAPPPPPASHSPSPVASVISDQIQGGGYLPCINGEAPIALDVRQDGSPASPPNHTAMALSSSSGKATGGLNSATPSPPLANKQQTSSNVNCDPITGAAPSVFVPQIPMIPIHGPSNGLVTGIPPHFPFTHHHHHTSNPTFSNGFPPEVLFRIQAPPFQVFGNNIYPQHQIHTANNSMLNSATNNGSNNGNIKSGCYNCGQAGHKAIDCKENTMDAFSKPFSLNLNPNPKTDAD